MNEPTSPKILVVDDDSRNIKVLQILLKSKGYTPITATNGQEALDAVKAERRAHRHGQAVTA
jgi:CheY-like chemotaxis protein